MVLNETIHGRWSFISSEVGNFFAKNRLYGGLGIKDNLACGVEFAAFDCAKLTDCSQERIEVVAIKRLVFGKKGNLIGHEEALIVAEVNFDIDVIRVFFSLLVDKAKELSSVKIFTHFEQVFSITNFFDWLTFSC